MENRYVVKTTLSREDVYALAKQQMAQNRLFIWVCCLLLVVGTIVNWIQGGEDRMIYAVATALLVVLSFFMDKFIGWSMYRNANKDVGETTYTFTDAECYVECKLNQGGVPYKAYMKLVENDARYFLYIQKRAAFVLPKQDFVEGDAQAFGKFIAEKTGKPVRRVRG